MTEAAERELLEFVDREDYRPLPQRELLHRLHVGPADRPAMRRIIRRLLRDGRLVRIRGGKLASLPVRDVVRGKLRRHPDGHGIVEPAGGEEAVFVSPRHIGSARTGAEVLVRLSGRRHRDGLLQGTVVRVLEAAPKARLGLFTRRGRVTWIQSFDPGAEGPLHVAATARGAAQDLDVVRWAPRRGTDRRATQEAEVIEVLGSFDDPATDTVVVAASHGLELDFPERVAAAAAALPAAVGAAEARARERFDRPAPVTIDGETARDFDDAIAVEPLGRGFRLYVHIADVAHFVQAGSTIDEEALRRGTSVYFPDRVIPMLPEKLSNDLCSLRPGEDRLVQSAVLDFTESGEPRSARFADGVIRSEARLTYTAVAATLDGEPSSVPPGIEAMLRVADRLRERLEQRRRERGSIDFDLPEPQILLDVEGVMTGITVEPRNRAHRMIEEFMIAANEAVAQALEQAERGTLYRIHEPPDPAKVEVLASFAARLGLELNVPGGSLRSRDIQRLLDRAADRTASGVLGTIALRSMSQARYSPDNVGHFGLASQTYCHFTSPIRRYPDLVVHRQLRALRQKAAPPPPGSHDGLRALGDQCSQTERRAETAERELLARKKLAFIAEHLGETFEGVVTGVASFGLFVQLVDNLVEGLVRIENLGAEWFAHDPGRFELVGQTTGRSFKLGDRVRVRVDRVDRVLQRVDFSLEGIEATAERARRRKPSLRGQPARRSGAPRRPVRRRSR